LDDKFRAVRMVFYFYYGFLVLFFIQRQYMRIQRERFIFTKKQNKAIEIFDKVIKMFHEGIVISEKGIPIYQNE
jgi:hypothetical protein